MAVLVTNTDKSLSTTDEYGAKYAHSCCQDSSLNGLTSASKSIYLSDHLRKCDRNILDLQNIAYTDYLQSICGDEQLLHFVATGKFGNVFVSPVDDRFVIKILRKSELKVMLEILPKYYRHVLTYRATLLSKLYGLHVVRLSGGVKAHIAVMSNSLKSNFQHQRCYDLKGTDIGRNTTTILAEHCPVLKDVDFDFCFYLAPVVQLHLLKQIKYDCKFLEDEGIMDYSLLLGIHFEGHHEGLLNCKSSNSRGSTSSSRSSNSVRSSRRSSSNSKMDSPDDSSEGSYGEGLSLPYLSSTSESNTVKLGVNMPGSVMVSKTENVNVVLNFGIVDIFQRYNVPKRIEHLNVIAKTYQEMHRKAKSF
ncbi:phosphatidylinositol 4-phosphate 5-kinase 10 isoform X1 [Senna tora]|uniref:1-phosphatidylinositol-4-phosphate 5-kinase n=1 Tax=Senna tora TaxID=362788 RepID=A0A834TSJ6_9FABA|nr:phosphatidylinositol 4-phosphate 5-kinase 10 isoform X1 [Senna tora]